MESLTQEQLAYIERHGKSKNPKTIARDLKLELRSVQSALKSLNDPKRSEAPTTRRTTNDVLVHVALILLIVVLGWVAYANNTGCGPHFDDFHAVLGNEAIKAPSFSSIYHSNQYRQVLYWTFAASWALHGEKLAGWHLENNFIHVLNGVLVYALVLLTLRTPAAAKQSRWPHLVAGLAGLIFVLHPVQTQAVTYITQRTESLCATFYLVALALYAWARLRRASGIARGRVEFSSLPLGAAVGTMILAATILGLAGKLVPFLVVSGLAAAAAVGALVFFSVNEEADPIESALLGGALLFALLACETKEIAITIPGAVALWELVFMQPPGEMPLREKSRWHLVPLAPYVAMAVLGPFLAVAVGLDATLLLKEGVQSKYDVAVITGKQYLLTELNVLATYVRLYFLPYGQTLDYDYVKRSGLFEGPTLLSLLALGGVVALAVRVYRKQPVFTFAVFFMLGVLVPTSFFVLPDFIFEHRIYLPLAAAAFFTALTAEKIARAALKDDALARKVLIGASVPVLVTLLILTRARNEVWATEETLWQDAHEKAPLKPRPLTNLGLFFQNVEPEKAVLTDGQIVGGQFLDGARLGEPDMWIVRTIFPNYGRPREFKVKKTDVRRGPEPWGGLEKAEEMYKKALEIDADYYKARNNYALCEIQLGVLAIENGGRARTFMRECERAGKASDPHYAEAQKTAERFEQEALSRFEGAAREFKTIIAKHPDDYVSLNNLGNLYFAYLNRLDDAIACVESSIAIDDRQAIIYAVAGEIYFSRGLDESDAGRYADAVEDYKKAVQKYRIYLERCAGDANYGHVLGRKNKAEAAIVNGGLRAEPKPPEGAPLNNPFQPGLQNDSHGGGRWKPPVKSQEPK